MLDGLVCSFTEMSFLSTRHQEKAKISKVESDVKRRKVTRIAMAEIVQNCNISYIIA